jgi:SAM-dependent methyltransferase
MVTRQLAWHKNAHLYDMYVTNNTGWFANFFKKEKELLDKLLNSLCETTTNPLSLIEVGSGTGRVLLSYINNKKIFDRLNYLIGIDYSEEMIKIALEKLEQEKVNHKKISESIDKKCIFINLNALEMDKLFKEGRIVSEELAKSKSECIKKLKPDEYYKSLKVVCCLLNTLGNIIDPCNNMKPEEARQKVVNNMIDMAGKEGIIVISVLSNESFIKHAKELYKSMKEFVGEFNDNEAFNNNEFVFRTNIYYSHWFKKEEIENIVKKASEEIKYEDKYEVKCYSINDTLKGYFVIGGPATLLKAISPLT